MKTSDFRSWHVFPFQLQNLVPLSQLLKCGKWSMRNSVIDNHGKWLIPSSSSQAPRDWLRERLPWVALCQPGATLTVVPGRLHPTTAMAGEQRGGLAAGPKWPGSVPSSENKEGHLSHQLSSPSHLSTAICHDLFMLPLLTASRYSESNFTGSKLSHQLSKAENTAWLLSYISASI